MRTLALVLLWLQRSLLSDDSAVVLSYFPCLSIFDVVSRISLSYYRDLKKLGTEFLLMMSSNTRNNYKAKWLAALADGVAAPSENSKIVTDSLDSAFVAAADATSSLGKIQHSAMEAAAAAKRVMTVMDELSYIAGIDFGQAAHGIDSKLSTMPLPVMLRRIRDILKMCETRIGVLSISAEESHEHLLKSRERAKNLTKEVKPLQATIVSSAWIGTSPTESELEDFYDKKAENFHRHGIQYEDLDDDWFDTRVGNHTVLRQSNRTVADSDDDTSEDESATRALTQVSRIKASNRTAALVPGSPVAKKDTFSF